MKRSGFVAASVLAIGLASPLAPTAAAQDFGNLVEHGPCSDRFRLPWEQASPTTDVVLSPFGTAEMFCASWHGVTQVYQLDPWGKKHRITMASANLGSINPPLGFYVWDPATF
ncbi:hypothetical protein ACGFIU_18110 [Rhodococcus oryzae]|uniref:hypothetical protein n=1 Tax=Rhodococcus TaxID=1827 RepID=UPI000979415E|nr:hypothetical protein [Rhodococcus sp. MTM3W5.2]AQA21217.1 hypothetical protein BTZ20_4293 [Rhodococcus sp. MTM3W5.2]